MSSSRYSPEFKDGAVRQVLEPGYSVIKVSEHLGVSAHSLYKRVKTIKPDESDELNEELKEDKREILKLRAEEDRDILKRPQGTSPAILSEVPVHSGESGPVSRPADVPFTRGITQRLLSLAAQSVI